jgi:hypothetical protein
VLSEIKRLTAPAHAHPRAPERRAGSVGHVPCAKGSGVQMPKRLRGGPALALGCSALSCRRAPRLGRPKRLGSGPGRATRRRTQHRAGLRACRPGQLAVRRVLNHFATPRPPRVCVPTHSPSGRACRRRPSRSVRRRAPLPCHRFSSSPLASAAA